MSFQFNLGLVIGAPGGGSEVESGNDDMQSKAGWSGPLGALPLAIHRLLNGDRSGAVDVRKQTCAVFFYETDRSLRVLLWFAGSIIASYVSAVGMPVDTLTDAFAWATLSSAFVAILVTMLSSLVGRFRIGDSIDADDVAVTMSLRLPWLIGNYQNFGIDRIDGVIAASVVILTYGIGAMSWGLILYVSAVRMLEGSPYRHVYLIIWNAFGVAGFLNAVSSSVSFIDARDHSSKVGSELTSSERFRVTLIQLKIFWMMTVLQPLWGIFPLYAYSES